jgi:hypothetical protein
MSDNLTVTGVVEFFGTSKFNNEDYSLRVSGCDDWFAQKKEWMDEQLANDGMQKPKKGDTVSFYRGTKKDGTPAKYIRNIVVTSGGGAATSTQGDEMSSSKDQMIIRQNVLRHATKLVVEGDGPEFTDLDKAAEQIIETARTFEAYVCGAIDALEAEAAREALGE